MVSIIVSNDAVVEKEAEEPKTLPPDESWYHRLKDILQKMENEPEIIEIDHSDSDEDELVEEIAVIGPKGIVDECCTNGCVYADILMYCA
ncbi:hypothetical protein DOY81_012294 [Sarcophaga bullata]|nr:hypothetical protein DOY81_012294 [Sarcophaga bullata]